MAVAALKAKIFADQRQQWQQRVSFFGSGILPSLALPVHLLRRAFITKLRQLWQPSRATRQSPATPCLSGVNFGSFLHCSGEAHRKKNTKTEIPDIPDIPDILLPASATLQSARYPTKRPLSNKAAPGPWNFSVPLKKKDFERDIPFSFALPVHLPRQGLGVLWDDLGLSLGRFLA